MSAVDLLRRAQAALGGGDWQTAETLCRSILEERPDQLEALNLLGIIHAQSGRAASAAELFRHVCRVAPANAVAHHNHGNALRDCGRLEEAQHSYERALSLDPNYAAAYNARGTLFNQLRRLPEALASYERALALRPEYAEAHYNRAVTLQDLDRPEEALQGFEQAARIAPGFADAHYNRGNLLHAGGRTADALEAYERALAANPQMAPAHVNRANVLQGLGRHAQALQGYERAIALDPNLATAHGNRAKSLEELGRLEEASAGYRRALAIDPALDFLEGRWLRLELRCCRWQGLEPRIEAMIGALRENRRAVDAHTALLLADDPALHRQAARISLEAQPYRGAPQPPLALGADGERIRLGYYSADYHNHATAQLAAGLFERHDRSRFEVIAFSFGPNRDDPMRRRLIAGFDRFLEVRAESDANIVRRSRELKIDIAIDLKGFTQDARLGIFARRAAPLQVNYLGYPGTLSAPFMDYIVADRTLIPAQSRAHYAERVIYLGDSYQVNDRERRVGPLDATRATLGLPQSGFVFCCFNGNFKIAPKVFECWMRILARTPSGVLWLLAENESAQDNLRREAQARGVAPERLVFARTVGPAQHLARYRYADLFLDTLPCNAHTTASDALWAGLPVLTQAGRSFAARVGASLLSACGLGELATTSEAEYENLAVALAHEPERIAVFKAHLTNRRLELPLFDTARFTRRLERAFEAIVERRRRGLEPQDIEVE